MRKFQECCTLKDTNTLRYDGAVDWLYSFTKYGWRFGLERISYLVEQLGNPQKKLNVIHVAGTNGKGSVCKFIGSILQKAGYTVGVYLSPHLERFSERIVINNEEISDEDLARLVEKVKPIVEEMRKHENTPTFFEIVTAIAFQYFHDRKVDYAVIEVGLGGRFDATNVVIPLVSVITNISLEHTDILGKDIASIAREKAGIIKEHVPVITAATQEARSVILKTAQERQAPSSIIEKNSWKRLSHTIHAQEFCIQGTLKEYIVKTSLLGSHQGENIALALAAIEQLQMKGVYVSDSDIIEGICAAGNPGRMEVVSEEPLIILDGAHNPNGMQMLVRTLKQDFTFDHLVLVLGILKDKDLDTMLSTIVPDAHVIVVTKSSNPRACDPMILKEKIEKLGIKEPVIIEDHVPRAITKAKALAKTNDLICVTGSLFTVGEARAYLRSL